MKRLMLAALAVSSALVAAQPSTMEHVLVSVPLHKKTAETAMPVTVFTGDALRRAASSTIGDTLAQTPGLANASFGPGVGQPVIRGQQGARVTMLQNGTSSADASNLSADHAVAVESMLADSIEVLRGPATLLYGGGAIGGVVNVIDNRIPTAPLQGLAGGLEYRHDGAADRDTVVLRADGGSGPLAFHLDGLYRDWNELDTPGAPGGRIDNSGGRSSKATLGGSYHFDDGFAGLSVSRLRNEYGVPADGHHPIEEGATGRRSVAADEGGGVRLDVESSRYDGALHWHNPAAGVEVMRAFLTYTDYEHEELEPDGEVGTIYRNETWEGRLELVHAALGPVHGVLGLQAKDGRFSALGEEAFIPVTDSRGLGLFLLEDFHTGQWTYEAGVRVDWDRYRPQSVVAGAEDFAGLSLSGSVQWDVSRDWTLGLALSRAERAPAAEELYSNVESSVPEEWIVHAATGSIELGDPNLDREVSRNIDLSVRWSVGSRSLELALYYNDFADYINLLATGRAVMGTPVMTYTQQDAKFYGLEAAADTDLFPVAGGQLRLELFGDSMRGELSDGADVPRLPPDRVGLRLNWSNETADLWSAVTRVQGQDRPGNNEQSTRGYTRWDLGVDLGIPRMGRELAVFMALKNIADEEIRLSTSFLREVAPEAGRSVEVGFRLMF